MPRKTKKSRTKKPVRKSTKRVPKEPLKFPHNRKDQPSGLAIAAFLFSLLGFVSVFIIELSWALSLVAVIFAGASLKKKESRGLSSISIIIALISMVVWLLLILFP